MELRPPPSHEILLPVRPGFIAITLAVALFIDLLPWSGLAAVVRPDFIAVCLLYWCIHEPRRLGFLPAWLLGLVMDVVDGSLFGQHALAYTLLAYTAIVLHRRVLQFGMANQVMHVIPLLLLAQLVMLAVRLSVGGDFPGIAYFAGSLIGAALWPLVSVLLKLPQRSRSDPDHAAI